MRVAYYTHTAYFELALTLVRALSRRADVDLILEISPTAWRSAGFDLPPRDLPAGLVPADGFLADAVPDGVRQYWRAAASFHLASYPRTRSLHPSSWRIGREVLSFVESRGADVLHLDDVDVSPRLALAIPGARRPPTVIAVHDPEPHSGEQNWRRTLARRLAYPAASGFVHYNRAFHEPFGRRHYRPVQTVGLGRYDVWREWGSAAARDSRPTVLFFGRISPYKDLGTLYAAVPAILERVRGARIVVAGRAIEGYTPPPPPPDVERIDRYLSNREIASLLQSADVVVCPYRDATQSGVVLTAFAFGVPIVATDVGGLAEYVVPERTGLIVGREDPRALADAVTRVVLDRDLRERLRGGIERAAREELNWERTVDTLVNFYSECRLQRRQTRGDIEENSPRRHARHRAVRPSGRRTR